MQNSASVTTFMMALHIWRVFAGIVTIALIASVFSAELQGLYYAFAGIVAMQGMFELGMNVALMNAAAREWARSTSASKGQLERPIGVSDGLLSVGRAAFGWYLGAGAVFVVLVGLAGFVFLDNPATHQTPWRMPWAILVLLTGLQLASVPIATLLEGCGRLAHVVRIRFWFVIVGSLASIATIAGDGGLWAMIVASAITGPLFAVELLRRNKAFLSMFLHKPARPSSTWMSGLWPMQWRLAIQNIAGYAATHFLTLLLFQLHGPVVAGRFGMSWQIAQTLNQLSMTPAQARAPVFAAHAARAQFDILDRVWRASCLGSLALMVFSSVAVLITVIQLEAHYPALSGRLLPPTVLGLLLLAAGFGVVVQCEALYLRAFGREPFHLVAVTSSAIGVGMAYLLGVRYQAMGVALAYLIATTVSLGWASALFATLRLAWRGESG